MTLDLDELERKAKALRDVATPSNEWGNAAVVILALIERVREMEARIDDADGIADAFVDGSGDEIKQTTANAQVAAGLRAVRSFIRGGGK